MKYISTHSFYKFFKKLFTFVLLFFQISFCEEKQELPKIVEQIDLIQNIQSAKLENFQFDEKKDLVSHWKKNPGRFSGLDQSKKWLNTQMTFNVDKTYFINHSQDSILLSPNSSIEFTLNPGVYTIHFEAGILADDRDTTGTLVLEVDGIQSSNNTILLNNSETWTDFERIIRVTRKIKFFWNSTHTFAFIAHPILTPSDYKSLRPNIVLFVIDAVRADSLGYAGFPFPTSPNIDKLAKESIVFPKTIVNANWTKPSMLSMFYSEYASNLGIGNIGFDINPIQKKIFYSPKRKNLIRELRANSYYTASIMNNVFLLEYTGVGFDIGFHELIQIGKDIFDTKKIADETIDFLNKNRNFPFLLHINFNTPHGSYEPPPRILKELEQETNPQIWKKENPIIRRYYGEIRYADEELGRIIEDLKRKNIYDETTILVTADHGELFSDYHTSLQNGIYGVKYGHGMTHFEEEITVPYLIKPAKSLKQKIINSKFDKQVSLLSLTPTLLGLSNISFQKNDFRGIDYSKYIFGMSYAKEDSIFTEGRLSESIRTKDYKYVRFYPHYTNSQLSGRHLSEQELEEYYDLKNDPEEIKNLETDKSLLGVAQKEIEKHSLITNSFHIQFPAKSNLKTYTGYMYLPGSIYKIHNAKEFGIRFQSKNNFSFEFKGNNSPSEIIIDTIHPNFEFNLTIYLNQNLEKYRIGKWGILNQNFIGTHPQILISHSIPDGAKKTDLPWIYNDAKLTGEKELGTSSGMGEEVRQILKSWGYIHE